MAECVVIYQRIRNYKDDENYNSSDNNEPEMIFGDSIDDALRILIDRELTDHFMERYIEHSFRKEFYEIEIVAMFEIVKEFDEINISNHPYFIEKIAKKKEEIANRHKITKKDEKEMQQMREYNEYLRLKEKYEGDNNADKS